MHSDTHKSANWGMESKEVVLHFDDFKRRLSALRKEITSQTDEV